MSRRFVSTSWNRSFPAAWELDYRYFHVFGNVPKKLES